MTDQELKAFDLNAPPSAHVLDATGSTQPVTRRELEILSFAVSAITVSQHHTGYTREELLSVQAKLMAEWHSRATSEPDALLIAELRAVKSKIEAIKIVRDRKRVDGAPMPLKDAKDFVEALEAQGKWSAS